MTRLLVHEAVTGGAFASTPLDGGLLAEGRLMVGGLLEDFAALPGVAVAATRDARLAAPGWPAPVETHAVEPGASLERLLDDLLAHADAALVIAPETDGLLERLTRRVERAGRLLLGARADAVRVAADKGATAAALAAAGVAVPPGLTVPFARRAVAAAADRLGFPLVVKPTDGVSGLGATRVEGPADLEAALVRAAGAAAGGAGLARARRATVRVERWIDGVAASAALVADGRRAAPLALNAQHVAVAADGALAYAGGATPLAHGRGAEALEAARRAVEAIPGLAGYAGVDLVLREHAPPVVIEVNPRLTTAYGGLRLVSPCNLAALILDACRAGRLPDGPLALTARAAWTTGKAWREEAAA